MIKAILFDLDDTLLGNDMDTFLAHYFKLLGQYARPIMDEKNFLQCLLQSTRTAIADTDTSRSNREVFWECFEGMSGLSQTELEPFFSRFYEEVFPQLQPTTQLRPIAAQLVQDALDRNLAVVIATNPLFPALAIEHRLEWAGIPVVDFPYALVTTYDNMHATKPQVAYYHEILTHIDCPPEAALMVGNDWENDILPAAELGLYTYWVHNDDQPTQTQSDSTIATAHGSLEKLHALLHDGWPTNPSA